MQAFLIKVTGFILSFFSIFTIFSSPLFPPLADFVPPPVDPVVNESPFMTVVENGATDYRIVIADSPAETVVSAAGVLTDYIARATGVTIPTVTAGSCTTGKKIVVSNTAADMDFIDGNPVAIDEALGKEGFTIRSNEGNIYIIGGNRGVVYGAYGFLEKFAGCHWYAVSCIVVPETTKLEVPVDIDVQEVPIIGYRETDWLSPRDPEYCVANRINGNRRYIYDNMGGNEGYTEGFCHTFAQRLPKEKYWGTDREIYAISNIDGERSADQLCLTNPRTVELMCLEIDRIMADNPDASLISLTQNDGEGYCVCPACKALDDAEGSHAGTMISFVNAVADYTKDKYPDLLLDTFAYHYTRTPPKTVKPRDNVVVRLCSYEGCFAHPLSDSTCPRNAEFASDLKTWGSISKNVSIWDYTTNYSHLNGPFPNFGVLQANVQFFVENNTVGIYEEGNYKANESNSEFADLRSYLLARLMWNPYLDYDAEMNGFLQAYYGDGWQYIREFIDITIAKTGNNGLHINIGTEMNDRALLNLKPNEIDYINDLWAKAKETAQSDYYRNNVYRSEISWRYWKANNHYSEYSPVGNPFGWYGENVKLYNDFNEFGIKWIRESRLMDENPVLFLPPKQWVP